MLCIFGAVAGGVDAELVSWIECQLGSAFPQPHSAYSARMMGPRRGAKEMATCCPAVDLQGMLELLFQQELRSSQLGIVPLIKKL